MKVEWMDDFFIFTEGVQLFENSKDLKWIIIVLIRKSEAEVQ